MIHWSVNDNIGYITIDSQNKNALGYADLCILKRILTQDVLNVNGIIIMGTKYSFCAGLNLSDDMSLLLPILDEVLSLLYSLSIPVVCALNGHAIGGGMVILCCADYIVSAQNERAKYGLPELTLGIQISKKMLTILLNKFPQNFVEQMLYTSSLYNQEILLKYTHLDLVESNEDLLVVSKKYIDNIRDLEMFTKTKILLRSINRYG